MWKKASEPSSESSCQVIGLFHYDYLRFWKVMESSCMICMHVCQYNLSHFICLDTYFFKLWTDFLFRFDISLQIPIVRMPPWKVSAFCSPGSLTGINDDNSFWMLNSPSINGKRFCPSFIKVNVQCSHEASPLSFHLIRPDSHASCVYRMNLQISGAVHSTIPSPSVRLAE